MIIILFYERNMKLLSEYQKDVFTKLQSAESQNKFTNTNVGFGKNENGITDNVVMDVNGKLFVAGKIEEAKVWAEGINTDAQTLVVFGLGMGWHVEFLAEKLPNTTIYVIEPDKRTLAHAMHLRDMEGVFKNCKIWLDEPINLIKGKLFEILTHPLARGIAVVPFYLAVYEEYSQNLYTELQKMMNDFAVMLNTKRCLSSKWYGNRVANAKVPSVNAKHLMDKFKGVPGIVVGAGPSLESQIEELRALQGKAVIIAASTAAEILKAHDIRPTFMIAIDQDPITSGGLHEKMEWDVPLLFDGQVAQNSLCYQGPKIQMLLNVNRYSGMAISDLPVIESGPSVANVSLDVLYKMGCSPILICGLDMSYTDNKLYCGGTQFNKDIDTKGRLMELEGMNGEKCYTEPSFLSMRNWYEEYIGRIKPPVYNCTARGIPITGAEHKKFSDFNFDMSIDVDKIVNEAYYKDNGNSNEPNCIDITAFENLNKQMVEELDMIATHIKATNSITPKMSQTKAWIILDEFVSSMTFLHEVRTEHKITKGMSGEEALKYYAEQRSKTILENIEILKEILQK